MTIDNGDADAAERTTSIRKRSDDHDRLLLLERDVDKFSARLLQIESKQGSLDSGVSDNRHRINHLEQKVIGLNNYISGDPDRRSDTGQIGLIHQEIEANRAQFKTLIGAITIFVLGILTFYFTQVHH